ncbi:MAG: CAP domain-containing protein [Hydrogenophaga sp.]
MNKTKFFKLMAAAGALSALAACGGGGDEGGGAVIGQNGTVDVNSVAMSGGEACGIGGFAQKLLAEINAARAKDRSCGGQHMAAAPAIPYWNTLLQTAAVKHSADMASNNFFSHTGSGGSYSYDRVQSTGYRGASAEILVNSTGSFSSSQIIGRAVNAWLNSPEHCQALMEQDWKEIGAGCVLRPNKSYLTLIFGAGQ